MKQNQLASATATNQIAYNPITLFANRWSDIQIDNTIYDIDLCITSLVNDAQKVLSSTCRKEHGTALRNIEATAIYVVGKMRNALALNPSRRAKLPFDVGEVLAAAVEQYVTLDKGIRSTIADSAHYAEDHAANLIPINALSKLERGYQTIALVRLRQHLIPETGERMEFSDE